MPARAPASTHPADVTMLPPATPSIAATLPSLQQQTSLSSPNSCRPMLAVEGGLVPDLLDDPYWDAVVSERHLALPLTITHQQGASFTGFVARAELIALIAALGVAEHTPAELDDLVLHGELGPDGTLSMTGEIAGPQTSCMVSVRGGWRVEADSAHVESRLRLRGRLGGIIVSSSAEWDALASW